MIENKSKIVANELRLGNLVKYNGMIMTVCAISSPSPLLDKRFDGKYIVELYDGGLITCTLDEISTVELTEELISNICFGYNNIQGDYGIPILEELRLNFDLDNDMIYVGIDLEIRITRTPLHRLQNIYHSITSCELVVK